MLADDDGKFVYLGQSLYLYMMNENEDEDENS